MGKNVFFPACGDAEFKSINRRYDGKCLVGEKRSATLFDSEESLRRGGTLRITEIKLAIGRCEGTRQLDPPAEPERQVGGCKQVKVGHAVGVDGRAVRVGNQNLEYARVAGQCGVQFD